MKLKPGFKLRPLGREFIVTPEGLSKINFNKMISLNSTAAYLWREVSERESFTAEDLADLLTKEYEVDYETALKDSEAIGAKWLEAGIAEE